MPLVLLLPLTLVQAASWPEVVGVAGEVDGVGRVVCVGKDVWCGPVPSDWRAVAHFDAVICVDSVPPESTGEVAVAFAATAYSGLSPAARRALASAGEGRVYVHCHHGRHRGPAAGVWLARRRGLAPDAAAAVLDAAGTGREFAGLWRDALGSLDVPPDEQPFTPAEPVSLIRRWMAEADRTYDADALTPRQRRLVAEAFRESARDETISEPLRNALLDASRRPLTGTQADCRACHERFRDSPAPPVATAAQSRQE